MGYDDYGGSCIDGYSDLHKLVGRTIHRIDDTNKDRVLVYTDDGVFVFSNSQDSCDNTRLESIDGDVADVIGKPITEVRCTVRPDDESEYGDVTTFWIAAGDDSFSLNWSCEACELCGGGLVYIGRRDSI